MKAATALLVTLLVATLVTALLIMTASPAEARHHRYHYRHHRAVAPVVHRMDRRVGRHDPSREVERQPAVCPDNSSWMPDPVGWPGLWVKRQGFQSEVELWWQRGGERNW